MQCSFGQSILNNLAGYSAGDRRRGGAESPPLQYASPWCQDDVNYAIVEAGHGQWSSAHGASST